MLTFRCLKPRHPDDTLQRVQIGLLPRLRSLSFDISCSDHDDWISATRIFTFLHSSHSGSLTHLSIDMFVYLASDPRHYFVHADLGWSLLDAAIAGPSFPSLESVEIRLISPGLALSNGPDPGVLDEARWDIVVRDLSPLAMASFPRTAQLTRGAPIVEMKLLMLDHGSEG